jgi:Leucine-rich repeat (LRR) protein
VKLLKLMSLGGNLGTVGILDLEGMGCEGIIPNEIGEFKVLKRLHLSLNKITGALPLNIRSLKRIESIDISCNCITGEYDNSYFNDIGDKCANIDFSFNDMSGQIPDCFYLYQALQKLNLSGNRFSGSLPTSIASLTSLRVLKMYNNNLEGNLHEIFSACVSLEEVNLSKNRFSGSPCGAFAKCTALERLNLSRNQLDYDLDIHSLVQLSSLQLLYLDHNSIAGSIGPEICSLKSLKFLNLSHNRLCGVLPTDFGDLVNLEVCVISGNQIIGPVPQSMSQLTNLKDFHVFNQWPSEFTEMPRSFKSFTFRRLYRDALSLEMDSLCWRQHTM